MDGEFIRTKSLNNKTGDLNLMDFDVYFTIICAANSNIKAYHKKAMEKFFSDKIGLIATREKFDEIFKLY